MAVFLQTQRTGGVFFVLPPAKEIYIADSSYCPQSLVSLAATQ